MVITKGVMISQKFHKKQMNGDSHDCFFLHLTPTKDIYILTYWKMDIFIFLEAEGQSLFYTLKVGSGSNENSIHFFFFLLLFCVVFK